MLSDYINNCESIRKAVEKAKTPEGEGGSGGSSTSSSVGTISSQQSTSTCPTTTNTSQCPGTTGSSQTSNCPQTDSAAAPQQAKEPSTPTQKNTKSGVITRVSATVVCTKKENKTTCVTVVRSRLSTSTKRKNSPVTRTNRYIIIKRCKSTRFTFCTGNNGNTTCFSIGATMCKTTVGKYQQSPNEPKCILREFCDKIKNDNNVGTTNKCKVLEEIKEECKKYTDCKECVNPTVYKKFVVEAMKDCKRVAYDLILFLNDSKNKLYNHSINLIILRIIVLQVYLRTIREFLLLKKFIKIIINNLKYLYNPLLCDCGDDKKCCTIKGKCLCTIFYKMFVAIKLLHDRYCKIIKVMNGTCDESLYKIIPSISIIRSLILIFYHFNRYIDYVDTIEKDNCTCKNDDSKGKDECKTQASGNGTNQSQTPNNEACCCHKYSSKLDDVLTLLLEALEDTDDCDGILSDVISMMSPLVEDKCVDTKTMNDKPSDKIKKEIEDKLKEVIGKKKDTLKGVPGLNGDSNKYVFTCPSCVPI